MVNPQNDKVSSKWRLPLENGVNRSSILGNKFRTSRKNLHILAFQFSDNKQTQHAGDVYVDINIFGAVHHFMNLLRKDKKTLRQLNNRANLYVEAKLQPVDDQRDAILIKQ